MFRDRLDAAEQLATQLRDRSLRDPLVLAIPRGGVVVGAKLAEQLGAELDIVLSRKLRAPQQPELAVGAIAETGHKFINEPMARATGATDDYLSAEIEFQQSELSRRKLIFRDVRPPAQARGRSVIITDDGIATGATMLAALQALKSQGPHEVIVAVPVAPPDRLKPLEAWCDEIICLATPASFRSVGQFYKDFAQVNDSEILSLVRQNVLRFPPKPEP